MSNYSIGEGRELGALSSIVCSLHNTSQYDSILATEQRDTETNTSQTSSDADIFIIKEIEQGGQITEFITQQSSSSIRLCTGLKRAAENLDRNHFDVDLEKEGLAIVFAVIALQNNSFVGEEYVVNDSQLFYASHTDLFQKFRRRAFASQVRGNF
ncbi:hypothetical protein DAPPUDRAFT_238840 [Daphnia pulex]|uniref:Uncharacterized protein n=1 Tax=Daphnia pulex TaxID=6669 RepID=E9G7J9_DAPPU|nr:hypothetical protein DAPPUDRAFT_238840 [Daphnia pulex]|eukprot:EFX84631.1 hypothetical protein DAPPUDRAFT_238840 [Daphnia pulex]